MMTRLMGKEVGTVHQKSFFVLQVSLDKSDALVAKNLSDLSRIRVKEGCFMRISRIRRPKIVGVIEGPTYRSPAYWGTPVTFIVSSNHPKKAMRIDEYRISRVLDHPDSDFHFATGGYHKRNEHTFTAGACVAMTLSEFLSDDFNMQIIKRSVSQSFFLAEISGTSPQKILIIIIYKNLFWIKESKKHFIYC